MESILENTKLEIGTLENLKLKVRDVICDVLEAEDDEIQDDLAFADHEDLSFSSVDAFDILVRLEKAFKVKISEDRLPDMNTINNATMVVSEILNN
jgi:acyl carrier protein